jgi:hypothetical protein
MKYKITEQCYPTELLLSQGEGWGEGIRNANALTF